MDGERKLYSINAAAYILCVTDLCPEYVTDERGSVYFVFPDCAGVRKAIWDYKGGNPIVAIHDFIKAIAAIRKGIEVAKTKGE